MRSTACEAVARERPVWSVGYVVLKTRPPTAAEKARGAKRVIVRWKIIEVSPVGAAAGVGTATLEARCDG